MMIQAVQPSIGREHIQEAPASPFMSLVWRTDESRRAFETHPVVFDAVGNGLSLDRYRRLLIELYHIVWHFNPVCAAGASRMQDVDRPVRMFLYEHMHEEAGHEQWVLNDLEACGVSATQALAQKPSAFVSTLTGYNYWAAERAHPCSCLGMMYALEVIASVYGGVFSGAMREALLLEDDRGLSFISSHATMDAEHMAQLRLVVNLVAPQPLDAIVESAQINFHHFTRMFETL